MFSVGFDATLCVVRANHRDRGTDRDYIVRCDAPTHESTVNRRLHLHRCLIGFDYVERIPAVNRISSATQQFDDANLAQPLA
jgi:hypothetical protein